MPNPALIEHEGVIIEVGTDGLKVRIQPASACGLCEARRACPTAEGSSEKIIDVIRGKRPYSVGDKVIVVLEPAQGAWAVFFGYILPFLLVFFVLMSCSLFWKNEVVIGLLAIGALIPYYAVLYFFREKIKKIFVFRLKDDVSG